MGGAYGAPRSTVRRDAIAYGGGVTIRGERQVREQLLTGLLRGGVILGLLASAVATLPLLQQGLFDVLATIAVVLGLTGVLAL
jgi:hypothetical protein